ncbi:MAG: hypothetical protein V9G19_02885 [Tetrasphaera sp.]
MTNIVASSPIRARPRHTASARTRWWGPVLAGAAGFWLANLLISLTPVAADYRSALSIAYVPMLLEAAAGGLVVAAAVTFVLARYPRHVPGDRPMVKALALALAALVVLTVVIEVPAKLRAGLPDLGRWLFVATVFNTVRVLALGVAIGWVTGAHRWAPSSRRLSPEDEAP